MGSSSPRASPTRSRGMSESLKPISGGNHRMLEVRDLHSGYGRIKILHGVEMHVAPREVVAIIGPNGAGKSTTFKTIVGFLKPEAGQVLFEGHAITGMRAD